MFPARLLPRLCLFAITVFGSTSAVFAQLPPEGVDRGMILRDRMILLGGGLRDIEFDGLSVEENVNTDGAILKTNPDLELDLEKAERYKKDGNYDVACQLWQIVLNRSGDTLYSEDGDVYFSLVRQVEKILATLPEKGLEVYRIKADAEAAQIMAQGRGPFDEQALSRIVRTYFVCSIGDDAAFKLACLNLDNHDFIGAQRLLRKIIEQHPDPSVPLDQIFVRISLCQAVMGDTLGARATLSQAVQYSNGETADLIKLVETAIENADSETAEIEMGTSGNRFSNFRVMPSLPKDFLNGNLVCQWQVFSSFKDIDEVSASEEVMVGENARGENANMSVEKSEELKLIEQWREESWRPVGKLLFDNDLVYYKSPNRMTAWRTDLQSESPAWQSAWLNYFMPDDASKVLIQLHDSFRGHVPGGRPTRENEIRFFGDLVSQDMAIHQGVLYSIEGSEKPLDKKTGNMRVPQNISQRRSRENYLTAYDAKSGRALWALPKLKTDAEGQPADPNAANDEDETTSDFIVRGGFMAAPIGFDNLLIVPVNTGGTIWVYALDANDQGRTVWKSFLCDEPESGADPWAPIQVSLSGSNLIVTCGTGVVFVVDASTGLVQFAKRYKRVGKTLAQTNNVRRLGFDGWSADEVIPYGNQMICFCSDTNMINAFDIGTGAPLWEVEMAPIALNKLDYILGIQEHVLYLAGAETVIAFDLRAEGMMLWGGEALFDGKKSNGRGMLTRNAIYLPIEDSIWKFDLKGNGTSANRTAAATVELGTGAPIGNLYSDGKQIWVLGANRVYALVPESAVSEDSSPNKTN